MPFNVFEGARRISYLIAGLWAIGFIGYGVFQTPEDTAYFDIKLPHSMPVKRAAHCGYQDGEDYADLEIDGGNSRVRFCFLAQEDSKGAMLVPYKVDPPPAFDASGKPEAPTAASEEVKFALRHAEKTGDYTKVRAVIKERGAEVKVWMDTPYSDNVKQHMKKRMSSFQLPPDGIEHIREARKQGRINHWQKTAALLLGGLAVWFVTIFAIGWIVRGFVGIPMGKDSRA